MSIEPYLIPYMEFNLKWNIDLNEMSKGVKFLWHKT